MVEYMTKELLSNILVGSTIFTIVILILLLIKDMIDFPYGE